MIAVENLTKVFGNILAVSDVSFRSGRGEITGLLGPNGSGKTTIMRILTGFFPPTTGRAWVAGVEVAADPLAARAKVGYLPENVVLYPDMRVSQFLDFCADVRELRGQRRRVRLAAVEQDCGLSEVRNRLVGKLSKGYRQRVGLAQALLHEPEVLILDEPTVGLDPRQIIEIRNLVAGLRLRTTILLSTHILPEAANVCGRVIIIDRGRIVAEDSAQGLTRRLQGSERSLVRIEGPPDTVRSVLETVPGVARVEVRPGNDGTQYSFVVFAPDGETVRKQIASVVVGQGWGLLEVKALPMSLEDLFVRLVNEEPAEKAT
jgi:ABC-2 type transport system ATP-binding protein